MDTIRFRLLVLGVISALAVFVWYPATAAEEQCFCLQVSFLDVGQGDAIFIETPDGVQVLIDGGADNGVLRELGSVMSVFDRNLDLIVATHPDLDHIGGLPDVLDRYNIDRLLITTNENDTPAAAALAAAADTKAAEILLAEAGQIITLGAYTYAEVLSPRGDETNWQSNNASIIIRIVFGDTAVMLSGDAGLEIENFLVERYGEQLRSDILKLGHHGSKTSTSEAWLDAVKPAFAVVSAGLDNRYGHPHQEVMQRVFARNIAASHTGTDGTVTYYSDGQQVWRK
jgi:competence protein ComEC